MNVGVAMDRCQYTGTCPYFNCRLSFLLSESIEGIKEKYCFSEYMNCARYQVTASGNYVPDFLSPFDVKTAHDLISHKIG